jgi:hypothetical protein
MDETARINEALGRLRAVFRVAADAELMDSDVAEIAGLEEDECRHLLKMLVETGAIEQPRSRVFICRSS